MNFDQRIAIITNWFKSDIATRFNAPVGVDPKIMASDCIEITNNSIPSGVTPERLRYILDETKKTLVRNAKTRTIPIAKDFSIAAQEVSKRMSPDEKPTQSEPLDELTINARRIKARQPVSESYLRGNLLQELLNRKLVDEIDIAAYKQ